jgi:hypothetical protein
MKGRIHIETQVKTQTHFMDNFNVVILINFIEENNKTLVK